MHVSRVEPDKKWLVGILSIANKAFGFDQHFIVDRFHALFGQRSCVFNPLSAVAVCPAVQHSARTKPLPKLREVLGFGIVRKFWFLLSVQVIEVAEEFIKAMQGWQVFIAIAKVVFAKLPGAIAQRL